MDALLSQCIARLYQLLQSSLEDKDRSSSDYVIRQQIIYTCSANGRMEHKIWCRKRRLNEVPGVPPRGPRRGRGRVEAKERRPERTVAGLKKGPSSLSPMFKKSGKYRRRTHDDFSEVSSASASEDDDLLSSRHICLPLLSQRKCWRFVPSYY